jgi:hypothetical protein
MVRRQTLMKERRKEGKKAERKEKRKDEKLHIITSPSLIQR